MNTTDTYAYWTAKMVAANQAGDMDAWREANAARTAAAERDADARRRAALGL